MDIDETNVNKHQEGESGEIIPQDIQVEYGSSKRPLHGKVDEESPTEVKLKQDNGSSLMPKLNTDLIVVHDNSTGSDHLLMSSS